MSELESIRALLRPGLNGSQFQISEAAEVLGTRVRTLQRQLRDHGASFSELVETTRFATAADLLSRTYSRRIDIAVAVGFDDQSNFCLMFRK